MKAWGNWRLRFTFSSHIQLQDQPKVNLSSVTKSLFHWSLFCHDDHTNLWSSSPLKKSLIRLWSIPFAITLFMQFFTNKNALIAIDWLYDSCHFLKQKKFSTAVLPRQEGFKCESGWSYDPGQDPTLEKKLDPTHEKQPINERNCSLKKTLKRKFNRLRL